MTNWMDIVEIFGLIIFIIWIFIPSFKNKKQSELEDIKPYVMNIEKGDVLVLKCNAPVSNEAFERIKATSWFKEMELKVILLMPEIDVDGIIKPMSVISLQGKINRVNK